MNDPRATTERHRLFNNLLTSEEVEAIIDSCTTNGNFTGNQIAEVVNWCNAARINHQLVIGVLQGKLKIQNVVKGEPIFNAVAAEKRKYTKRKTTEPETEPETEREATDNESEQRDGMESGN
jgi:hypothetical protein